MGLFRKTTSMMTFGAVDFRSDKERTAAYTKAVKKEAEEQTRLVRLQALQQAAQRRAPETQARDVQPVAPPAPAPQLPPAGWYPDQRDASIARWFDGTQWTDFTQPPGEVGPGGWSGWSATDSSPRARGPGRAGPASTGTESVRTAVVRHGRPVRTWLPALRPELPGPPHR